MCVHGNAIEPTSSGCGSMRDARPMPAGDQRLPSECITHFGAAVVPDVEYSQRTASPSVGRRRQRRRIALRQPIVVGVTTRISNGSPVASCSPFGHRLVVEVAPGAGHGEELGRPPWTSTEPTSRSR